jgi:hypothetical protein
MNLQVGAHQSCSELPKLIAMLPSFYRECGVIVDLTESRQFCRSDVPAPRREPTLIAVP